MANNTTNRLRVEGQGAEAVKKLMEVPFDDGEIYFDFSKIVPEPTILCETWSYDLGRLTVAQIGLALLGSEADFAQLHNDWKLCRELGENFTLPQLRSYAEKIHPDAIQEASITLRNREATGFDNWREWSSTCWGTTGEAYRYQCIDISHYLYDCYFETRWSPAVPIVMQLSQKFPELKFRYYFLDDGDGFEKAVAFQAGEKTLDKEWFNFCHAIY